MSNDILACTTLSPKAFQKLEQICRKFTWGKNCQGGDKVPLIAWEVLQYPKKDGGLGIPSFQMQGEAMRLRQILRFFQNSGEDWMAALGELARLSTMKGSEGKTIKYWEILEILLTTCLAKIGGVRTTTGLLTVWAKARKKLVLPSNEMILHGSTQIGVYLSVGEKQGWITTQNAKDIRGQLRKHKIQSVGAWADWASFSHCALPLTRAESATVEQGLHIFVESVEIQHLNWSWKDKNKGGVWKDLTTKDCKASSWPQLGEADPYRMMENDQTAPRSISDGNNRHSTESLDPLEDKTRNPLEWTRQQGERSMRCEISEKMHRSLHPPPDIDTSRTYERFSCGLQIANTNEEPVAVDSTTHTTGIPTSSPVSTADQSLLRHSYYAKPTRQGAECETSSPSRRNHSPRNARLDDSHVHQSRSQPQRDM
ncbi:hypothetical protein R1sor_000452 [Riccia sorocarpa]|uniref:Uncharacterized protein n=1 Tax=Riccia sorocarpa TaxID=122646 RepID=A0ABD3GWA7_9MARC